MLPLFSSPALQERAATLVSHGLPRTRRGFDAPAAPTRFNQPAEPAFRSTERAYLIGVP